MNLLSPSPAPSRRSSTKGPKLLGLLLLAACATLAPSTLPAAEKLPPSVDPNITQRPGKFVWADVFTSDPAAIERFYTKLFNWKAKPVDVGGGAYVVMTSGGRPVGGIARRPDSKAGARWVGYISTENTGRAAERMRNNGAKMLVAPREVPGRGNQAILTDPEGAVVGIVTSSKGDAPDFRVEPGHWAWAQLFARNPTTAADFYRRTLGYELHEDKRVPGRSGVILASGGFARAGVGALPAGTDARPSWLGFVRVSNLGESIRRTKELGGKVLVAPRADVLNGRVAIISDPLGGAVGIFVSK